MIRQQMGLEKASREIGIQSYRRKYADAWNAGNKDLTVFSPERKLLSKCIPPVADAIAFYRLESQNIIDRILSEEIDRFELAYITARHCINKISIIEPTEITYDSLATDVALHFDYSQFKQQYPGRSKSIEGSSNTLPTYYKREKLKREWRKYGIIDSNWPDSQRKSIGKKLIDTLIEATGLFEIINLEGYDVLMPIEDLLNWLKEQHLKCECSKYIKLPMVTKPLPWNSVYDGGYYTNRLPIIKSRKRESLSLVKSSAGINKIYSALNSVQETPYRINRDILKVLLIDELKADWEMTPQEDDKVSRQLWLAQEFKDAAELYFPWNLDWRGRMYPLFTIPVHPQADDIGKALIEFSRGKPLGKDGVYWLAVHGANCHGEADKESLDSRYEWVIEHENDIIESANDPLNGERFWEKAENKFQFLAFCFEWAKYKESRNDFVSHTPVAIDASCNGIQHLAYYAGDIEVSIYVNTILRPSHNEPPRDFYGIVAEEVKKLVSKDAQEGDKEALFWVDKINRSLVKRNVMTLPYGASHEGFKNQLMDVLKNKFKIPKASSYKYWKACGYLAKKNREAIGLSSNKLIEAMTGIQSFAGSIAKNGGILPINQNLLMRPDAQKENKQGQPFPWVNPIGLTVIQNYKKPAKRKLIKTFWGDCDLVLSDESKIDPVASKKGIVPNFIHSSDSSHMMFTILKMVKNDIHDFSMVHDSFGCHACDAGKMEDIIWEVFDELYSRQRKEFLKELGNS